MVTFMVLISMDVREYLKVEGTSPFGAWFAGVDPQAAAKLTVALVRLGQGNFSKVKDVGSGVFEYVLDFGPGYRIYKARTASRL